jgi:hypothetical protein
MSTTYATIRIEVNMLRPGPSEPANCLKLASTGEKSANHHSKREPIGANRMTRESFEASRSTDNPRSGADDPSQNKKPSAQLFENWSANDASHVGHRMAVSMSAPEISNTL